MAETMQQKVAREIYEGRNGRGCAPWSRLPHAHQAPYLADARAAIETLMTPTPAMKHEAARAIGGNMDFAHDAIVRAMQAALSQDASEKGAG